MIIQPNSILGRRSVRALISEGAVRPKEGREVAVHGEAFDLHIGARGLTVKAALPSGRLTLNRARNSYATELHEFDQHPITLEERHVYLFEVTEQLDPALQNRLIVAHRFPAHLANVRCRIVWILQEGWPEAWLEVVPLNGPVSLNYGQSMVSVRVGSDVVRETDTVEDAERDSLLMAKLALGIPVRRYVPREDRTVGTEQALGSGDWVDVPIEDQTGVLLEPRQLYMVPVGHHPLARGDLCQELIPYDPRRDKVQLWRRLFIRVPVVPNGLSRPQVRRIVLQGLDTPFLLTNGIPVGLLRYYSTDQVNEPAHRAVGKEAEPELLFIDDTRRN